MIKLLTTLILEQRFVESTLCRSPESNTTPNLTTNNLCSTVQLSKLSLQPEIRHLYYETYDFVISVVSGPGMEFFNAEYSAGIGNSFRPNNHGVLSRMMTISQT